MAGDASDSADRDITHLLNASAHDRVAADQLLALVYDHLHQIARQRMADERHDHTLQATVLVHDAYMRLVGDTQIQWSNRAQFYHAAGQAIRRLLIDHARARGRVKRGAGRLKVPLSVVDLAAAADLDEILALDEAICRLEREEPDLSGVVRLRFFAGLTVDETAATLGLSPRTVDQYWAYARAWLYRAIEGKAG